MGISIWKPEHEEALRKYCSRQLYSSREISGKLNEEFQTAFTRNSVIGKMNRLKLVTNSGLKCQRKPARSQVKTYKPRLVKTGYASFSRKVQESAKVWLRCVEIECAASFEDLVGCRYPVGDGPFLFCNGERREESSYCTAHHALCHEKPKPRDEKYLVRAAA